MPSLIRIAAIFGILSGTLIWSLATPKPERFEYLQELEGDASNGEYVFNISWCANCHSTAPGKNKLLMRGGLEFETVFGIFYALNFSTEKYYGIEDWRLTYFTNVIRKGVIPSNITLFHSGSIYKLSPNLRR